jgi:hypothetical protein
MEEKRNACKITVAKSEGKRLLTKHRHRWEDNNEMDLGEITWDDMDLIHLPLDTEQEMALENRAMKLWFS